MSKARNLDYQKSTEVYRKDAKKKGTFNEADNYKKAFFPYEKKGTKQVEELNEFCIEDIEESILKVRENKNEIFEALKKGNLVVLANHDTWANLVILAYIFHKAIDISYEEFFIIVGPAITLDLEHLASASGVANVVKTLPEKLAEEYPELAKAMFRTFLGALKKQVLRKIGKIIFLAPSGTTDKFEDGKILMKNPKNGKGVVSLINKLSVKEGRVMYIGTNTREVFPNKKPAKGKVYMKISEIIDNPTTMAEVRKNLKPLVLDKNGREIGEFYKLNADKEIEIIID